MAARRGIDAICVIAVLAAIALTILFMNGEALGLKPMHAAGDDRFTSEDENGDWSTAGATRITLASDTTTVEGGGAYAAPDGVHIVTGGKYVLSGTLADGTVTVETDGKDTVWLRLDGADIACSDGAALLVENAGKVIVTLAAGTENRFSAEGAISERNEAAGIDGALYSRDDLTVNGSGSLTVTAAGGRHGIVCNDDFRLTGGTVTVSAEQDGIHVHDSAAIRDAILTIRALDDGISVSNDEGTGWLSVASGCVTVTDCYEGLEATIVTVAGGTVAITPTDDGINAMERIEITGGDIRIVNPTGLDADGLDSNGDIVISGGRLFVSVSSRLGSSAIDYGSENGGSFRIDGGSVLALGGSMMLEAVSEESAQPFVQFLLSGNAEDSLTVRNTAGDTLWEETVPCDFSCVTFSMPTIAPGEECAFLLPSGETAVTVDSSSAGSAFGGFFGGGRGGERGNMPGGEMPEFGDMPQPGEMPDMGDMPQPGEKPDFGGMPQPGEKPDFGGMPGPGGRPDGMPERGDPYEPPPPEKANGT